ncbi:heme oxygenase-like multi-helical [Penicillium hispanicum]|uniref:heme oxygenase-like multi-helical n=1 Tax=Penicillium hispanicum TaxID=1080232 RepID=UPI0025426690|nr:heme oxygenase-like multi-helical [Penicillium hispanicum]KAJ5577588.1 heme oxygenase-like multi-helical [Penicillium hispanicum]
MTSQGPLTSWLLSSTPQALRRATTHPFLAAAGRGTLPKSTLSQWLSQDRLYAQSYIRFVGLLLAKIRLPPRNPNPAAPTTPTTEHQAVDVLIDALNNIRTELRFFDATAAAYGLDLTAIAADEHGPGLAPSGSGGITTSAAISTSGSASCPGLTGACESSSAPDPDSGPSVLHRLCNEQGECQMQAGSEVCEPSSPRPIQTDPAETPQCESCRSGADHPGAPGAERGGAVYFGATRITRAYIDLFVSAGGPGVSVIEGLAVLWATEVCYLRAWRYAAAFLAEEGRGVEGEDADGGALREKFIPNWSSAEFEQFVNQIGDVLDTMAGNIKGVDEAECVRGQCLEWWRQVVWLEEQFWPAVE